MKVAGNGSALGTTLLVVALGIGAGWYAAHLSDAPALVSIVIGGAVVFFGVLVSPAVFVAGTLAVVTNVFGVVSLREIHLAGDLRLNDALLAFLLVAALFSGVWRSQHSRSPLVVTCYTGFLNVFFMLMAIFLLLTTVRYEQGVWDGVKDVKVIWYYAVAYIGLLTPLDPVEMRRITKTFIAAGVLSAVVSVIGSFFALDKLLPGLSVQPLAASGELSSFFRTYNPGYAVIHISLFLALFDRQTLSRWQRNAVLVLTGLATLLMGFRAFWIGIAGAIVWLSLPGRSRLQIASATLRRVLVGATLIAFAVFAVNAGRAVTARVKVIPEDISRGTGSIGARMVQVSSLWRLVARNPALGVGFVHPEGPAGGLAREVGLSSTATVDVGWMDILSKVGILGAILFGWLFFRLCRNLRGETVPHLLTMCEALRAFIIMGLLALPGAALFTWDGGVVPLALALGAIDGGKRWFLAQRSSEIAAPSPKEAVGPELPDHGLRT